MRLPACGYHTSGCKMKQTEEAMMLPTACAFCGQCLPRVDSCIAQGRSCKDTGKHVMMYRALVCFIQELDRSATVPVQLHPG